MAVGSDRIGPRFYLLGRGGAGGQGMKGVRGMKGMAGFMTPAIPFIPLTPLIPTLQADVLHDLQTIPRHADLAARGAEDAQLAHSHIGPDLAAGAVAA